MDPDSSGLGRSNARTEKNRLQNGGACIAIVFGYLEADGVARTHRPPSGEALWAFEKASLENPGKLASHS